VSLGGLRSLVARVLVACSLASLFVMVQVDWLASLLHLSPLHGDDLALAALGGLFAGAGAVAVRMVLQRPGREVDRISRAG
jgi:hypothetical protein